jgi:SAM-dependent methyltransferase
MTCPLCLSSGPFQTWIHRAWRDRRFLHCPVCDVVFVPPEDQVSPEKEKARYQTHQNDLGASGFRDFLMKTVSEIGKRLPKGSRILDFGSGPEPSMSNLLVAGGYEVVGYDPSFQPQPPEGTFDLVLAHEVFEHLREPRVEVERILNWLRPHGTFVIRSELRPGREAFADWWYARDFTHILFPSEATLQWMAEEWALTFELWSSVLWTFRR